MIAFEAQAVRPFTDKQIELVDDFADQAVIAIENVRLFEEVRRTKIRFEQQTATSEVLGVITVRPSNLSRCLTRCWKTAARLCERRFGTMLLQGGSAFSSSLA